MAAAQIDRRHVLPPFRRKRRDRRQHARRRGLDERPTPGTLDKSRPDGNHVQIKLLGNRRQRLPLPLFTEHIQAPKRGPRMALLIERQRCDEIVLDLRRLSFGAHEDRTAGMVNHEHEPVIQDGHPGGGLLTGEGRARKVVRLCASR